MKTTYTQTRPLRAENTLICRPMDNQNGSVIVLALMALAIMTVIGIVSTNMIVTENYIIRNVGIHKQNNSVVDSALMVGLQQFMQLDPNIPNNFNPAASAWINSRLNNNPGDPEFLINTIWYENAFTQRCLDALNSNNVNTMQLLTDRNENLNGNLRYAVVGWELVPGTGFPPPGQPGWYQGRILAEYVSSDGGGNSNGFGLIRQELGVRRKW